MPTVEALLGPPPTKKPAVTDLLGPAPKFESNDEFHTRMDEAYGAGRWRDTGDYRTPARERQLAAQGALTARGTSPHSRGSPDAPGAHDIVVSGMTPQQAAARLPSTYKGLPEGREGTQGPHLHVGEVARPAVTDLLGPAPKPKVTDLLGPPPAAAGPRRPAPPSDVVDPVAATSRRFQERVSAMTPPDPRKDPVGFAKRVGETMLNPAGAVGDIFNAAVSPVGGAAESLASRLPPTTESEAQKHDPKLDALFKQRQAAMKREDPHAGDRAMGDIAEALTPIPVAGEAGAVSRGLRTAREALAGGREAAAAEDAARLKTSSLPKPGASVAQLKPRKPMAAAVEMPPRTDVVGDEANPATRTSNALYRLGGHDTDAKIELGRTDAAMRKQHGPETDEALYHALEEPDKPMTPEVAAAKKDLDPLLERQTAVINRLRERADPTLDAYLTDSGYVHRIKAGDESALDENAARSPFESRKSLAKKADSQRQRKFIALEDSETGKRTLIDTSKDKDYRELRPGMEYRPPGEGPAGAAPKVFKVVSPTTREIEAGSDVRYQKSAIHNTAVNVYQLERAERNLDVIEQTLSDMKERGVAHREEWHYRDPESGKLTVGKANEPTPKGFVQIPDNATFKGWKFDPKDAQVQELKDWLPDTQRGFRGDALDMLDKVSNFALRSNFLSPIVHPKNIAEFWAASRGGEWLNPAAYGRMAKTLGEAAREVYGMGPKYRQLLREGSALLSADSRTQKFTTLLTDSAAKQMFDDPKGFAAFKKALGDAAMTPVKAYTAFQKASHNMMWSLGDIMMMQRVLELQEKGTPIRDAIKKAEDVIPNYRVPAQIMDSKVGGRFLNSVFSNNRWIAIGRYHYNRMAAYGRMAKKVAVGTPEEKAEAIGQLLVVAVQAAIVAPLLDKALKLATGNENARVKRGGITALPDAVEGVSSGREGPAAAIAQVLDIAPLPELGYEMVKQKDWKGDDLASKYKSTAGNIAGEVSPVADTFGPLQGGIEALQPGYGAQRVAGNMFGVDLPEKPQGAVKGSTAKMLRSKYKKQDRKDPFVQTLEGLGVQ